MDYDRFNNLMWLIFIFIVFYLPLRLYINLYSPTNGSKERNIQTYKYGEKATKEKPKKKQQASVGYTCHYVVTCDNTIVNTSLLY